VEREARICLLSTLQQHDSGQAKVYEGEQENSSQKVPSLA